MANSTARSASWPTLVCFFVLFAGEPRAALRPEHQCGIAIQPGVVVILQLSTYSRVNLHHLVYHIMALSRSELERRQLVLEWAKDAGCLIYGDSVQIQLVLLNLVVNAIDAMANIHH